MPPSVLPTGLSTAKLIRMNRLSEWCYTSRLTRDISTHLFDSSPSLPRASRLQTCGHPGTTNRRYPHSSDLAYSQHLVVPVMKRQATQNQIGALSENGKKSATATFKGSIGVHASSFRNHIFCGGRLQVTSFVPKVRMRIVRAALPHNQRQ